MSNLIRYLHVLRQLRQQKPTLLSFNVTNRCNERCAMCNVWRTPAEELSVAEIARIFSNLREIGIQVVEITGGEPLLRTDLPEVIDLLDRLGFLLTVSTNGTLWRDDVINALRRAKGLVQVAVSLDSLKRETYARLRGVDALPAVLENIDRYAAARLPSPVKINFAMSGHNLGEFFPMLQFARSRRMFLSVFPANSAGERLHSSSDPLMEASDAERLGMSRIFRHLVSMRRMGEPLWEYSGFYELCADLLEGKRPGDCGAGRLYLDLHADGKLAPCLEREPLADLRTEGLSDLRERVRAREQEILRCSAGTPCCYTCTRNVALTARHPVRFALETALVRLRMRLHGS